MCFCCRVYYSDHLIVIFFFSSRRRHTRCALVTGVQTCALPICCHFSADWAGMQRANLYSRLATRILLQVAHAEISHEDDILDLARSVPWERWFGAEQTLRVDTSAIKSPVQSLQYCNLRAKDGICDRLRDRKTHV